MTSSEIRETFLKFFEQRSHQRVRSSSLIPAADPSLLFTNSGMVQFKDAFLGLQDPPSRRITSCQKCVRAGGKHNDLENVGFTARHHTFFEMLGNFSFGDYFKKIAVAYAWELVTKNYAIPKDRLWITVFENDEEAFHLWQAQGIPKERIVRLGENDNFWAMGETGPCGPCSEIHYDWGEQYGCKQPDCNPGCECGTRFLEIWNLVFMQSNRDASGQLQRLPKPSVDTGAGLERLSAVLQGVYSNYDTDLFLPLRAQMEGVAHKKYGANAQDDVSMRVIADHLRACSFLLADGVIPGNEGRGYVLRRILRRAIRHGKKLGRENPFLYTLVAPLCQVFKTVYPELEKNRNLVENLMQEEEKRFHETLHRGMGLLDGSIAKIRGEKKRELPGEIVFKLYDTFGFPPDLIEVICKENSLAIDRIGFESFMEKQRSQSTRTGGGDAQWMAGLTKVVSSRSFETGFVGYQSLESKSKALCVLSSVGTELPFLGAGEEGFIIFNETPFYAESGGQVGDTGILDGNGTAATIKMTFKIARTYLHRIVVDKGRVEIEKSYFLQVDPKARRETAGNHTATHLLHAALRIVLGERVKQAGSLVEPARIRFDFTFPRGLTEEEIETIETLVNEEVRKDERVSKEEMAYDLAIKNGALAFFDEKYGNRVRVVRVGEERSPFSVELCAGTHLDHTSEIGIFKIISEASVASGVRRMEAITSTVALEFFKERAKLLGHIEQKLNVKGTDAVGKIEQILNQQKHLQRENEQFKLKLARGASSGAGEKSLFEKAIVGKDGIQVVADRVESANPKVLRMLVDQVQAKLKHKTAVMLVTESEGKVSLCIGITADLIELYNASDIARKIAPSVGGTGGGRADFAQAGGTNVSGIENALNEFKSLFGA